MYIKLFLKSKLGKTLITCKKLINSIIMHPAIFLSLSLTVTFLFFIYGYNCYYLMRCSSGYRVPRVSGKWSSKPEVAVHLPIYNERYVVVRLVDACCRMAERYGREKVRIMILDDSTDDTREIIDRVVSRYRLRGFRITVVRRDGREGYKAGALQNALNLTKEEFIAIFDADFIPPPDFLDKVIPYFLEDERVGIVQCRWGHINREYNILTRSISIGVDAHFIIEQPGRYASGCLLNFNGSAGVLRRKAVLEAGGWSSDTLAEDLDLSYRIQLKGYKIIYLRDVVCLAEVPPTMPSFKMQQSRWARGSLQVARKLIPAIIHSDILGIKQKIQAFIHLTYYLVHPLMFSSFMLAVLASLMGVDTISLKPPEIEVIYGKELTEYVSDVAEFIGVNYAWIILGSMIVGSAIAAWIYYYVALRRQGISILRNLQGFFLLGFIGYGISLSNTIEAVRAFLGWGGEFRRTPKYAVKKRGDDWKTRIYHVPLDLKALTEILAGVLGWTAILHAYITNNIGIIPIIAFYTISYILVATLTITQSESMIRKPIDRKIAPEIMVKV